DGIRYLTVTGVQSVLFRSSGWFEQDASGERGRFRGGREFKFQSVSSTHVHPAAARRQFCAGLETEPAWNCGWRAAGGKYTDVRRSEERRVGKEWSGRRWGG